MDVQILLFQSVLWEKIKENNIFIMNNDQL